jgi:hypothetical protein
MDSNKDYNTYSLNLADLNDTLDVGVAGGPTLGHNSYDTITLPSFSYTTGGHNTFVGQQFGYSSASTITSGPYGACGGAQYPNVTVNSGPGFGSSWLSSTANGAGKIRLEGEDADVEVNGWSLVAAVKRIEQRLGLFQPNPELEAEWAELGALAEQYRKLEQHIRDKQATWDRIKAMPAPEVD